MLRAGENWRSYASSTLPSGRRLGGTLAVGIALATAASCTLILDFDEPIEAGESDAAAPAIDATPPPDAAPSIDAIGSATCDAHEPNNDLDTVATITPGIQSAAICPDDDVDFYGFSLLADTELTITLTFDNSSSDLNLRLYNDAGAVVVASVGTDATELIQRGPTMSNALPAGTYRIEVFSVTGDITVDYDLNLELTLPKKN